MSVVDALCTQTSGALSVLLYGDLDFTGYEGRGWEVSRSNVQLQPSRRGFIRL